MRGAHNTPLSVKAGNLARWFPPWTVTREQWHSMSRPSVSGIAIDMFLFSRIGMPLFHRYRVFDRLGGHPAFRGPYMSRLFAFLKEADAALIRRSHRRRAKEIAASMSRRTSSIKEVPAATSSSRRSVQCTPVSKITGRESGPSLVPPAGSRPQVLTSSIYHRSAEQDTVQALMDLSLPRFMKLDDGVIPKTKPWPVTENPPASPTSAEDGNRTRTPSPCMDLDDISMDSSDGLLPIGSESLLPGSPEVTVFEDQDALSCLLSPNRVREGHSQDMPAEGSIFDVSPDLPGFNMRPAGGGMQQPEIKQPPPSNYVSYNDPFFGAPITFAQCHNTPGTDTPTTVPIYNLPKDSNIGSDQSAVPTVFASGVSPDSIPWSTAEDIIRDIVREGPFDAGATPMETEDSPLISTAMPGCPYRMTSYTGTALVDADTAYGLQLHHPRFLEFIGAPDSYGC